MTPLPDVHLVRVSYDLPLVNSLWRARRKSDSIHMSLPFSRARCLRLSFGSFDNTIGTRRGPYFSCVSPGVSRLRMLDSNWSYKERKLAYILLGAGRFNIACM